MAMIARCTVTARLDTTLVPDVVLADPRRGRLFVGDAKATETAGCAATSRRLRRYARGAAPWRSSGYVVRLAVCTSPAGDWSAALAAVARDAGAGVTATGTVEISGTDQVSWVDLAQLPARPSSTSFDHDGLDPLRGDLGIVVFPDPFDEPAGVSEKAIRFCVSRLVGIDLLAPPQRVRLRRS